MSGRVIASNSTPENLGWRRTQYGIYGLTPDELQHPPVYMRVGVGRRPDQTRPQNSPILIRLRINSNLG